MKRISLITMAAGALATLSCGNQNKVNYSHETVDVELANAGKTISYTGALVVNGTELTLSDVTIESNASNEIAVLVINGGKLTLNNCKIVKTGDGVSEAGSDAQGGTPPDMPQGAPADMPGGATPPAKPEGEVGMPGPGGPGAGEDGFNFYGTNSAIVAAGKNSSIVLNGCSVETNAEYANAVFSTDDAVIEVVNGITINTSKNSSRGLYATCAGSVKATGDVNITTHGAHCAALATDRGGGYVTVGLPDSNYVAYLNTYGDGSPSIYSTGDITAYNANGLSKSSQAIVVEGKNHVVVVDSEFEATDPGYGGIMLYQSFSGDAETGTATLAMINTSVRDNGGVGMFLVTNTDAAVTIENCKLLNAKGEALGADDYLIVAKNCNTSARSWGTPGSNGGQLSFNATNQVLAGKVLAAESDSRIGIVLGEDVDSSAMSVDASGKGVVSVDK